MARRKLTFVDWLERRAYKPKTIKMYAAWHRRLGDWLRADGRPPVTRCGPDDIRAFADEQVPYTYSSRLSFRNGLTALWAYLGRPDCPTWAFRTPTPPEPTCRALPEHAADKLLLVAEETDPRHYAAVCLLYFQALRREEAAGLPWWGFDVRPGWVTLVGKGDRTREHPVHDRVAEALERLPRQGQWVLPGRRRGTHLAPATLNLWVRILGAGAGLGRVTPHMLRHTAAATALDATKDLRGVARFLGHTSTRHTVRYTRTTEQASRAILAALSPGTSCSVRYPL